LEAIGGNVVAGCGIGGSYCATYPVSYLQFHNIGDLIQNIIGMNPTTVYVISFEMALAQPYTSADLGRMTVSFADSSSNQLTINFSNLTTTYQPFSFYTSDAYHTYQIQFDFSSEGEGSTNTLYIDDITMYAT